MNPRISFVPAATETFPVAAFAAGSFAIPAVDTNNPDVTISHTSGNPVWFSFGPGAVAGAGGTIQVPPGYSVLLTSNAAVLAAAKDALVQGGGQAAQAGSQTNVAIYTPGNCQVTITRGTASAMQAFA